MQGAVIGICACCVEDEIECCAWVHCPRVKHTIRSCVLGVIYRANA